MPKRQLTNHRRNRQRLLKGITFVVTAVSLVVISVVVTVIVSGARATDQGATGTSLSSSLPAASRATTSSRLTTTSSVPPPTTTVVTRTEVLETNPCRLVTESEVFAAFKAQQSPMTLMSPRDASAIGPLQQRTCSYQSLFHNVSITTLVDDSGQYLPPVKAGLQSDPYFRDASSADFARRADKVLGDRAFRTLNSLYFQVKSVVVVITITNVQPDRLVDHETPLLAIGKIIGSRVYTLG